MPFDFHVSFKNHQIDCQTSSRPPVGRELKATGSLCGHVSDLSELKRQNFPRCRQVTEVQSWVAMAEKTTDDPEADVVDGTLNKLKTYFAEKQKLVQAL